MGFPKKGERRKAPDLRVRVHVRVCTRAHERAGVRHVTPGGCDHACRWLYVHVSTWTSAPFRRRPLPNRGSARCPGDRVAGREKHPAPAQKEPLDACDRRLSPRVVPLRSVPFPPEPFRAHKHPYQTEHLPGVTEVTDCDNVI